MSDTTNGLNTSHIEIVLAEFGTDVDVSNLKKYFSKVTVYTDLPEKFTGDRAGWRNNDYWKVKKLLESEADVAISFDGDMEIISNKVYNIDKLVRKFGLCLPVNPRGTVECDARIGADGDNEESYAHALNMTPIAFYTKHKKAREVLEVYCRMMLENPKRGPLVMWRAIWEVGFMPCLLPAQWCVCEKDIGIGGEIILHIGHTKVKEHYAHCNGSPR